MPDTDAVLAQINTRLGSIDKHLEKLNGRLGKVEEKATVNDKNIAVITTKCQYVTHAQDGDIKRVDEQQQRTDEKLWQFFKDNWSQAGQGGLLFYLTGKVSGWW